MIPVAVIPKKWRKTYKRGEKGGEGVFSLSLSTEPPEDHLSHLWLLCRKRIPGNNNWRRLWERKSKTAKFQTKEEDESKLRRGRGTNYGGD